MTKYVFVYGTLMEGEGNHRLMTHCGGVKMGVGQIYGAGVFQQKYATYPYMITSLNYKDIALGEVYRFEDDADLSTIETMERSAGYSSVIQNVVLFDNENDLKASKQPTDYIQCITWVLGGYYYNDNGAIISVSTGEEITGVIHSKGNKWVNQ